MFLRREADAEVVVEVAAVRRHPLELPAHALAKALDLGQRRARDDQQRDVAMRQVHVHAVDVVGHERAARAALLPARAEHEVLHQQLAAAFEQVGERCAGRRACRRRSPSRCAPTAARGARGRSGRAGASAPSRAPAAPCARRAIAPATRRDGSRLASVSWCSWRAFMVRRSRLRDAGRLRSGPALRTPHGADLAARCRRRSRRGPRRRTRAR